MPPRNVDRPYLVPKIPPQLADDGRRGIGAEPDATGGINAVNGVDEPDLRHLDQVLKRLTAIVKTSREVDWEVLMRQNERVPNPHVTSLVETCESLADISIRRSPRLPCLHTIRVAGGRGLGIGIVVWPNRSVSHGANPVPRYWRGVPSRPNFTRDAAAPKRAEAEPVAGTGWSLTAWVHADHGGIGVRIPDGLMQAVNGRRVLPLQR